MPEGAETQTYQPNAALAYVYRRFFDHIEVDEGWLASVRSAASRGSVVYVLRHQSFVDFLALDHTIKRFDLPPVRFAQDLGLWLLEPMGKGWLEALLPSPRARSTEERLRDAFSQGGSAVLFLKRPPSLFEQSRGKVRRGRPAGDEPLRALLRLQRARPEPILLVPQTFIWSKRPDTRGADVIDFLFGAREWPGKLRTTVQLLANYRDVDFRAGEVLDLSTLAGEGGGEAGDEGLVRRVTYALLTRLERERRAVLGPAQKPADRVREDVIRSPKLQAIIRDLGGEGRAEQLQLTARAYRMLREMEALPMIEGHRAFELALTLVASRIYAGVEVDEPGLARVREAAKAGTVIFLPSHKSHFDYIMLSHVLHHAHIQLPLIAAGDNLAFFPMGPLFRRGGAFFIRRSFRGDRLYAAVVDAYLRRLVRDGWAIEFFLEGGRSRTGKLLPPKFGLLNIVCDAALSLPDRPVTFVPVSIGYERVVEERSYVREMTGGEKRKEDARALLRGTRVLSGFYGRVNVQFGEPLTLARVRESMRLPGGGKMSPGQRRSVVTRLAHLAMAEINRVTSVTPGSLAATALLSGGRRGLPHKDLVSHCARLVAFLERRGARMSQSLVTSSGAMRPDAVREAAKLFVRGDLLRAEVPGAGLEGAQRARAAVYTGDDVVYSVPDDRRISLSLAKNNILHFFVDHGLVSVALLVSRGEPCPRQVLEERVRALSRLFKYEFMFRADARFEDILADTLGTMLEEGELAEHAGSALGFGPGHEGQSGEGWVRFHADLLSPFLTGYLIAARALSLLVKGPMPQKDLVRRALVLGDRMFLSGEINRREAVSRPILENGFASLVDLQYIQSSEGKLSLAPSFDSTETVGLVEARLRAYLPERRGAAGEAVAEGLLP